MAKKPTINTSILDSISDDTPFVPTSKKQEIEKEEVKKEKKTPGEKKKKSKNEKDVSMLSAFDINVTKFDKSTKKMSYISQSNHSKLLMLSSETGHTIMDIGDSIISSFFEKNGKQIQKMVMKKMAQKWE